MKNKNRLLFSDIVSVLGSGISDVALLTLAFYITNSAIQTAYILSLKLLASMLVFFILPSLLRKYPMRRISILSDLFRASSCLVIIFTFNIYCVALFAVIISFCTGISSAVKTVGFQKFVDSHHRVGFISKQQFLYNSIALLSPLFSALIIKHSSLKLVFIIECWLFFSSALIQKKIPSWDPDLSSNKTKEDYTTRCNYIFKDTIQLNILLFRISILTSMVAYQLLSTYIIASNYSAIIKALGLYFISSFPDVLALFASLATLSLLIGSLLAGKYFAVKTIKKSFLIGSLLISIGCLLWALPYSWNGLLYYFPGTLMLFIGLSLLRVSLYTSGQELTKSEHFSEVIAASDMIARTYQSFLGLLITMIISIMTANGTFLLLSFSALASIVFSSKICKELQKIQGNGIERRI